MNGFAQIRDPLAARLEEQGIPALAEWTRGKIPALSGVAAVTGIRESESGPAAFWNYLGTRWDEEKGCAVERYGRTVELTLFVDLYAPKGQAAALEEALRTLEELILEQGGSGVSFHALRRGAIEHDGASGYLKSRCTVGCRACFTATRTEEGAPLTDFILKGVLQ